MQEDPTPGPLVKVDVDYAPVIPKLEDMDPDMASWYTFDDDPQGLNVAPNSPEVLSDNDSDNADVAEEDIDFDDWFQVKAPGGAEEAPSSEKAAGKQPEAKVRVVDIAMARL